MQYCTYKCAVCIYQYTHMQILDTIKKLRKIYRRIIHHACRYFQDWLHGVDNLSGFGFARFLTKSTIIASAFAAWQRNLGPCQALGKPIKACLASNRCSWTVSKLVFVLEQIKWANLWVDLTKGSWVPQTSKMGGNDCSFISSAVVWRSSNSQIWFGMIDLFS